MGIGQAGDGASLTLKAQGHLGIVHEIGADDLEGDVAPQRILTGQIDGAHAATTDAAADGVAAGHHGAKERIDIAGKGHGRPLQRDTME